tara:strand:- start:161 stop:343 length:183 start_codon:yes stop_codon:yes gene_type:complete
MTKKPKIVIDLNDKTQLDLFGGEDIPVSDEIKEAIDVFKNPPINIPFRQPSRSSRNLFII